MLHITNGDSVGGTLRQTVHIVLKRWAEEQFAGLHAPHHRVTLKAMHEVKKLARNPELGTYRASAGLKQMEIFRFSIDC